MATVALLERTPESERRAGAACARRQHLPLRHQCRRARRGAEDEGGHPWLSAPAVRCASPIRSPTCRLRPGRRGTTSIPGRSNRGCSAPASAASTARRRRPGGRSTPTTSLVRGCSTGRSCVRRTRTRGSRASTWRRRARRRASGRRWRRFEPGQKVMYAGEEIAAVAAATEQQAEDAVRLIKVDWEVLPHLATVEQAMRPEAPKVFEPGNTRQGTGEEHGDIAAGLAGAAHVVEGTYSTQVQTHTSLETHGCVCEWSGDNLTAWVSTQAVHGTREGFASGLKIPQANVRVITEYMGGGFGSKFAPDAQGLICARLARAAARAGQADARSQGGASRHGQPAVGICRREGRRGGGRHAHGVRRALVGHRRRGRGLRLSASVHLRVPQPAPGAHRRLHQCRPAARDAGARSSAGVLRHRSRDGRAGRCRAHGPGRVPAEEPAPAGAERDVAALLPDGRRAHRLEQPASHGRPGAGTDQARPRLLGQPVGRRRPGDARALRDQPRRQRARSVRARRTSAPPRGR